MSTFPRDLTTSDGDQHTSLICPNCGGAISIRADGERDLLTFRCRVGHVYSLEEFLVGKEDDLEYKMWSTIHAYEEMAEFLDDLAARLHREAGVARDDAARRRQHAQGMATRLRDLFEEDRRISLKRPSDDPEPAR
jgi:two-component system chemotaxis response regulator CheB